MEEKQMDSEAPPQPVVNQATKSKFPYILVCIIILILIVGSLYLVLKRNAVTKPGSIVQQNKESTVSLQTQYQNPFNKSSQYVNPFSTYKNPLNVLQ